MVIIKKGTILDQMPEDVVCSSLTDKYAFRPKELEQVSLAEFASWYQWKRKNFTLKKTKLEKEMPEQTYEEDFINDPSRQDDSVLVCQLHNGSFLYKRHSPKIIRCVRYSKNVDPENYFREKLMLYIPWRKEDADISSNYSSYEDRYRALEVKVNLVASMFEHNAQEMDKALEDVKAEEQLEKAWDEMVPLTQHTEVDDKENLDDRIGSLAVLHPDSTSHQYGDFGEVLGCPGQQQTQQDLIPHRISNNEYKQLMISLNRDQQMFLHHILHLMKTGNKPFCLFLSGGAGVGKSHCLMAIYHTLLKFYDSVPGGNPEDIKVLLTAPTGKAAFNIQGGTLHSTFLIPANQKLEYKQLDQSRLNTVRSKLRHVKLVIIDKISMVGANMFNFINQRLQDIMGNSLPFGGINLLLVGDLFQLRPVKDKWIFQHGSTPYAPLAPVLWESLVTMFELTRVMRQSEDQLFASALNRIREGNQTAADIDIIKSRMVSEAVRIPADVLHLFTKHDLVDHHNERNLGTPITAGQHILETDSVLGDATSVVKSYK